MAILVDGWQETEQRLAVERALDAVIADSFPASDPPSWTLGVTRLASATETTPASEVTPTEKTAVPR